MNAKDMYDEFVSIGMSNGAALSAVKSGLFSLFNLISQNTNAKTWSSGRRYPKSLGLIMSNDDQRKKIIENCMNDSFFIHNILSVKSITATDQLEYFITCADRYKINPSDLFLDIVIKKRVQALKNSGFIDNPSPCYNNNENFREAQTLLKYDNTLDYKKFTKQLLSYSRNYSFWYCAKTVETAISKWAKDDYKGFYKEIISDAKSRNKDVREAIYCGAIMSGNADRRLIRRVRSDASEKTSIECVKRLFAYQNAYSNFSELTMYLTDTNYYMVADYLADSLPVNSLSSLMGTKFGRIRENIQRRIREAEELKESENG